MEVLAKIDEPKIQEVILMRSLPQPWKNEYFDYLEDGYGNHPFVQKLKEETVPVHVLEQLSKSLIDTTKNVIAGLDRTPLECLIILAKENFKACRNLRTKLINGINITNEGLNVLAKNGNQEIKKTIALYPNTPEEILQVLKNENNEHLDFIFDYYRDFPLYWKELIDDKSIINLIKSDQDLPSKLLDIFCKLDNEEVNYLVIIHPNVRNDTLEGFRSSINSYETKLLDAFLFRELPLGWKYLEKDEMQSSLKNDDVPSSILSTLSKAKEYGLRRLVALHPNTPQFILDKLINDPDTDVRKAANIYRKLPLDWRWFDEETLESQLKKPDVPFAVMNSMARSPIRSNRIALAVNPNLPKDVLNILIADEDPDIKEAVLFTTLPSEWRELDEYERFDRLEKSDVSAHVLKILIRSPNPYLREAVAKSPSATEEILTVLLNDPEEEVAGTAHDTLLFLNLPEEWRKLDEYERYEKLNNNNIPDKVITTLSTSFASQMRMHVAKSPSASESVLTTLAQDQVCYVKEAAEDSLRRLRLPNDWKQLNNEEILERIKANSVSDAILIELAQMNEPDIRIAIAKQEHLPEAVTKLLAHDHLDQISDLILYRELPTDWRELDDWEKYEKLAEKSVSQEILSILARSKCSYMRSYVAKTPSLPKAILAKLKQDKNNEVKDAILFRDLPEAWKDVDEYSVDDLIIEFQANESVLLILSQASDWRYRRAVAAYLPTPNTIIETLRVDPNKLVRDTVLYRELPSEWQKLDEYDLKLKLSQEDPSIEVLKVLSKSADDYISDLAKQLLEGKNL